MEELLQEKRVCEYRDWNTRKSGKSLEVKLKQRDVNITDRREQQIAKYNANCVLILSTKLHR